MHKQAAALFHEYIEVNSSKKSGKYIFWLSELCLYLINHVLYQATGYDAGMSTPIKYRVI
jgi:hypothetical protein